MAGCFISLAPRQACPGNGRIEFWSYTFNILWDLRQFQKNLDVSYTDLLHFLVYTSALDLLWTLLSETRPV
jgi:hypothetical protein